jgi:hypothetical protein
MLINKRVINVRADVVNFTSKALLLPMFYVPSIKTDSARCLASAKCQPRARQLLQKYGFYRIVAATRIVQPLRDRNLPSFKKRKEGVLSLSVLFLFVRISERRYT